MGDGDSASGAGWGMELGVGGCATCRVNQARTKYRLNRTNTYRRGIAISRSRRRYAHNCSVNDLNHILISQAFEDIDPIVASRKKAEQTEFVVLTDTS